MQEKKMTLVGAVYQEIYYTFHNSPEVQVEAVVDGFKITAGTFIFTKTSRTDVFPDEKTLGSWFLQEFATLHVLAQLLPEEESFFRNLLGEPQYSVLAEKTKPRACKIPPKGSFDHGEQEKF